MEKFTHKKMDPNEIPIIFVRDCKGNVQGKVSINEWNERRRPATLNELEIKLYRQSLVYYADQEYEKATDLLKFLIARTEYTRFEYIERLANIYHIMNEPQRISVIGHRLVSSRTDCPSCWIRKETSTPPFTSKATTIRSRKITCVFLGKCYDYFVE